MTLRNNKTYDEPAYSLPEAAAYLKVPQATLRYWLTGFSKRPAVIAPAELNPIRLSFFNLLECHALAGMRKIYNLRIPKVRAGLRRVAEEFAKSHPLVNEIFLTDRKDLFIERMGQVINVSQPTDQLSLDFYRLHLERVETDPRGAFRFFPFVRQAVASEPKTIEINPLIGFGKPVLAGTGISTAIIASRFGARESVTDLAEEYECSTQQIEDALRWEHSVPLPAAA